MQGTCPNRGAGVEEGRQAEQQERPHRGGHTPHGQATEESTDTAKAVVARHQSHACERWRPDHEEVQRVRVAQGAEEVLELRDSDEGHQEAPRQCEGDSEERNRVFPVIACSEADVPFIVTPFIGCHGGAAPMRIVRCTVTDKYSYSTAYDSCQATALLESLSSYLSWGNRALPSALLRPRSGLCPRVCRARLARLQRFETCRGRKTSNMQNSARSRSDCLRKPIVLKLGR